jgi:carotenoid cleavage dioxygenase-like enzyme
VCAQVCSWAIRGGRCHFRNRFVRTDAFCAEQAAGRPLFRGAFSAGDPSGRGGWFNPLDLSIKAIANTGVLHWAGRTYALHEVRRIDLSVEVVHGFRPHFTFLLCGPCMACIVAAPPVAQ